MMHIYNEPNGHDLKIIFSKNLTDMTRMIFYNDKTDMLRRTYYNEQTDMT